MNKIFIKSNEYCYDANPTVTLNDEYLKGSITAGVVCVGFLGADSINKNNSTTSNGPDELPFMQFKTVSGSKGEYKSDFNNLKAGLYNYGDEQYLIPSVEYSYTKSLFYGSLSCEQKLIFKTALFIKDRGCHPVVLIPEYENSTALTYLLASENIDSITTTYCKNG